MKVPLGIPSYHEGLRNHTYEALLHNCRIIYQILIWWDTNWRNLHHLAWKEMHQVMEKKRWGKKKWVFNEIKRSWDIIWSRQRERGTYRACRFKFYKLWCSPESKPVGVRSSNFNQLQLCILCMVYPSHLVIPDMVAEILHVQWKDLWIWRAGFFRVF